MVPFGGWNMPVQYPSGILAEHQHTRTAVSLFDCSHMGQFRITGDTAADELDRLFPRRVGDQKIGTCRYNFLLNERGTIEDDLIVYRVSEVEFYLVVNAATAPTDARQIEHHLSSRCVFVDESSQTAKLDLQGPAAIPIIQRLTDVELPRYFRFVDGHLANVPCRISRTGYTGECGVELYFATAAAESVWDALMAQPEVKPAGLGARDTLRLEMGYPLYGHELDTDTTPVEAGFASMLDCEREFVGREGVMAPPRKTLIAVNFEGRRAVREGSEIVDDAAAVIGHVTSGSFSPSLGHAIALAYVPPHTVEMGSTIYARSGRQNAVGAVTKLPFYRSGTARM